MKKMKKLSAALTAVVLIILCFSSCTATGKETQFKETADGYGLYRYKGSSVETEYTVPDTYNGKPVTELQAFSVSNAEYLKALYIGENIKTIDVWALTNCPALEKITVSENNPYFCSVDGVLYTKDMTAVLAYPNSKTPIITDSNGAAVDGGKIVLPNSVREIRENAFYLCSNLYSVEFNEGLEIIGNKAFLKCSNLKEIKLPSTLKTIGADAFSYCSAVTELAIPASVEEIGDYAFFITGSKIEKIIINRADAEGLKLGENWTPTKINTINEKVPVEYVG